MWPGFDSRSRCHIYMWVGFVVVGSCSCSEMFFNLDTVDEEPTCGCAAANSHLFIYLFICLFKFCILYLVRAQAYNNLSGKFINARCKQ